MDFYAVLDQVIDLLRQRQRVTYRALKVQFQLDDEALEALKGNSSTANAWQWMKMAMCWSGLLVQTCHRAPLPQLHSLYCPRSLRRLAFSRLPP